MKHLTKRALSLLLAALMVLSLIPAMPHAHAAEYGAEWTYGAASSGVSYEWLTGVFNTADSDFIYGTSYDWAVTLSPTKAAAIGAQLEATIKDASNVEVAKVTKTFDAGKAPAVTTILSHKEFTEQMAGKTGDFLLTVTIYYAGVAIAQLKAIFGYTGNASDNEGAGDSGDQGGEETPTLGEKWEFHNSYIWLNTDPNYCKFITAETDYIYEEGKAYDWSIVLRQGRTTVNLTVDATIKDENDETVAYVLNKTVESVKGQEVVFLSAEEMSDLTGDKLGTFLLECVIKYSSTAVARVQVRFSRTGAAGGSGNGGFETNPEDAVSVQYRPGNDWLGAAFNYTDEDLVYEQDAPYDWNVTVSPSKTVSSNVDMKATIADAEGNVISTVTKTLIASEIGYAPAKTEIVQWREFAELTRDMAGSFTLTCDLMVGETVYARVIAKFSRTPIVPSDGWEPAASYTWIDVASNSGDSDWVFENDQPYDFKVGVKQQRTTAILQLHAMIKDSNSQIVTELTKDVEVQSSAVDYVVVLEANEFTELTTGILGDFALVCEFTYNGSPVGRYTKNFSRTCAHTTEAEIPAQAPTCTDYGLTAGKECANCHYVTLKQNPVDPLGHDMKELSPRIDPTCKTTGKSAHNKCQREDCDYETGNNVLPQLTEHVPGAAATCLAPQTCIHCPEVIITPAKNHTYSVTDGKCINGCGKTKCENEGHNYVNHICTICEQWEEGMEGATIVSVIASQDVLYWGDTVTFTISVSPVEHCYNGGFMFEYDKDIFEYVSGEALVSGYSAAGISDVADKIAGYFMDGDETVKGAVFQVTFRVKENAVFGDTTVSGMPSFTMRVDGVKEDAVCVVLDSTVNIACRHSFGDWIEIDEVWHKHICTICSYEETVLVEYTVTFQYEDGTVITTAQYHYGDVVVAPDAPPAQKANHAFIGWDREIEICTGETTYTAIFEEYVPGDMDGDGTADHNDAIYLLLNVMFGDVNYPLSLAPADLDGNGVVEQEDAVFLLLHSLFGEEFYPMDRE